MISVAMAIHQGERFLAEQLASLAAQSQRPGEVVIWDDASTDRSVAIAREFAASAPFPVTIESNEANEGSTASFERAIRRCQGEIITLCDQDDLWLPAKLERIEQAMVKEVGFAFSDADLVDEQSRPRGERLWPTIGFTKRERSRFRQGDGFPILLRRPRITGATMAFRADLRDCLLPIPPGWLHDAWIALMASALATCAVIEEPLIQYRQHGNQQIGAKRRSLRDEWQAGRDVDAATFHEQAVQYEQARVRLVAIPGVRPEWLAALSEKVAHLDARFRIRGGWRLPGLMRELWTGRYFRYSRGWASVVQDVLL